MSALVRILIVVAVSFAVWGDFYLKRYSNERMSWDLIRCLCLWEICAVAWVFVYRERVSLGRTTAFGAAIAIIMNTTVGVLVFGERLSLRECAGMLAALVSVALLG